MKRRVFANVAQANKKTRTGQSTTEDESLTRFYVQQLSDVEMNSRMTALKELEREIKEGPGLPLLDTINNTTNKFVFYRGVVNATVMIIGEAPGKEEANQGKPFVGPSGVELDKVLKKQGVNTEKHAYVTNLIPVRPPNNRDPTWEEVNSYIEFLRRQILIIRPKVILTVGRLSSTIINSGLLDDDITTRGQESTKVFGNHEISSLVLKDVYMRGNNASTLTLHEQKFVCHTYASYHPSYILRLASKTDPITVSKYRFERTRWGEDFKKVSELLKQARLEYIDISDSIDINFTNKAKSTDQFSTCNTRLDDIQQVDYISSHDSVIFQLHTTEYLSEKNLFRTIGRTKEGHSVCCYVEDVEFSFYIGSKDIKNQSYSETNLSYMEGMLGADIRDQVKQWPKYRSDRFDDTLVVKLEYVSAKNFYNYSSYDSFYIKVTYHQYDITKILKESLVQQFGADVSFMEIEGEERSLSVIKFFESNLKPEQHLYNHGIFTQGWVEVKKEGAFKQSLNSDFGSDDYEIIIPKTSTCDLEIHSSIDSITGYSPIPGHSDKKWEDLASVKVVSVDAEMLCPGKLFPRAEQDPIVSICAYSDRFNRGDDSRLLEEIRDSSDSRKTKLTGRSNYDEGVAFVLGSMDDLPGKRFKAKYLPNIPLLPKGVIPDIDSEYSTNTNHAKTYSPPFIASVLVWDAFVKASTKWIIAVGEKRAKKIYGDESVINTIFSAKQRPKCFNSTLDVSFEEIKEWEKNISHIRKVYRSVKQDEDISVHGTLDEEFTQTRNVSQAAKEKLFGTIQARWEFFHSPAHIFRFGDEKEMLRGFYNYLKQYDCDILAGYGTASFDLPYFIKRVRVLGVKDENGKLISMGRIIGEEDRVNVKVSITRAFGERRFTTAIIPGLESYDFLHYIQKERSRLPSSTLGFVSQKYIGDTKNDVPYSAIPSLFKNNREKLNAYCLKDAELVLMLMNKLNNINEVTSMVRVIGTIPIGRLYTEGQQAKVFSVVYRYVKNCGENKIFSDRNPFMINPSIELEDGDKGYEGAFVFDPKYKTLYSKTLLVLDFQSLYPNLMVCYNLGHDVCGTFEHMVKHGINPETECEKTEKKYLHFKSRNRNDKKFFYFIRKGPNGERESALVGAIRMMLAMRKAVKREMNNHEPGSEAYMRLDAAQLAWKILVNSLYGACGVEFGRLAGYPVSEFVTLMGKYHLQDVAQALEKVFGAEVVGGDTDSVFVNFPSIKDPADAFKILRTEWNEKEQRTKNISILDDILVFCDKLTPEGMVLEPEKFYVNYFATAKKRALYQEIMIGWDDIKKEPKLEKPHLGFKGTDNTRRDSCKAAQKAIEQFAGSIVLETKQDRSNLEEVIMRGAQEVKDTVDRIRAGNVPFHEIVQARQLSKSNYANDSLPHVTICKKKRARGEAVPELGQRVPFVVIAAGKGVKMGQAVEDPDTVINEGISPDYDYIIEKKIMKPIMRFTNCLGDLGKKAAELMFGDFTTRFMSRKQEKATRFKEGKKIQKTSLTNDNPLAKFVKLQHKCIVCTRPNDDYVCIDCRSEVKWEEIISEAEDKERELKTSLDKAEDTCKKCMSVKTSEELTCSNADCAHYFPRRGGRVAYNTAKSYRESLTAMFQTVSNTVPTDNIFDW